jgi:hypothetical protein
MPKKSEETSGSAATTVYQLKITLSDVEPLIWRRVQVEDCSLAELHYIIQVCMGWNNSHLYAFEVDGVEYSAAEMGEDGDCCDSYSCKLSHVASQKPRSFFYLYDFGDDWGHVIKIERSLPAEPNTRYPRCTDGKRACPPEDCGGASGYETLLEAIQDPGHAEHAEMLEWVGGKFNSEAFNVKRVNRGLERLGREDPKRVEDPQEEVKMPPEYEDHLEEEGNRVDHPENESMGVLVVVAFPRLETQQSEKAWEEDIVSAVSAAVYADKTLDTITVRPLEYEDCVWVFEGGMPMPDYGVTVGQDGSWHSGTVPFPTEAEASGEDLQSLFDYLVKKGLVKN